MTSFSVPARLLAVAAVCALASAAGCRLDPQGPLNGRASDEWRRSYALAPDAEMQIVAADGSVDAEAGAGPEVEVKAERLGFAPTDDGARELLPRIEIREDVTPERVVVQTEGLGGVVIGVRVQVNYHVSVPPKTRLRVRTASGPVTLTNLDGRVVASSANGEVVARGLRGGIEARVANGRLLVELAALGSEPVDLRTTNGSIALTLPADADANLSFNVTNGRIDTSGFTFDLLGEATPRRVRGRLNAGGTPVELNAVNGSIRVQAR